MRLIIIPAVALLAALLTGILPAEEKDGDFVAELEQQLPPDWKAEFHQRGIIVTSPPMDVVASRGSSGERGIKKRPLSIEIHLTPKYSSAMIKRVDAHNAAIEAELAPDGTSKEIAAEIARRQIERPRYYDANYGISFDYPSYCPARESDSAKVRKFIADISKDWTAYDNLKKSVVDDITGTLLDKF